MTDDSAAGASAARNKLAAYFRDHGIPVRASRYGCPPTDEDFLKAVLATVNEEGTSFGTGKVMVLFKWWLSEIQVVVPEAVIGEIERGGVLRHDLFTATSAGGWNTLYLATADDGAVKVHRKKHWRKGTQAIDTTLLYAE